MAREDHDLDRDFDFANGRRKPTLYRVVDENPYRDRCEEWDGLTLDEAATRIEDLYDVEAAQVISDVEEGVDWPVRYVDEETGREITFTQVVGGER
jgi:hypothetical protein